VAMDWKWLFIYPEQGIATVNELVVPVDVPVRFKISATSVMNAFYVPELAGMIYAMPGMETTLNAVQNKPIQSVGFSANYSGAGYSDMRFGYRGVPQGDFNSWVQSVKAGGGASVHHHSEIASTGAGTRTGAALSTNGSATLLTRDAATCAGRGRRAAKLRAWGCKKSSKAL